MSEGTNKIADFQKPGGFLDLDALFGGSSPIKVRLGNIDYTLRKIDQMSPVDYVRLQKLQHDITKLTTSVSEITEENGSKYDELVRGAVAILSPELAAMNIPFLAGIKVLEYYMQQIQAQAPKVVLQTKLG